MMVMDNSQIKNTYEAWYVYQGLYAHFRSTDRNYDYFKYFWVDCDLKKSKSGRECIK